MAELDREEAAAFVQAVVALAQMADRALPVAGGELQRAIIDHLGAGADGFPAVSMSMPSIEHVNLQLAIDAFAESAESFEVIGLPGDAGNYGGLSITAIITGRWRGFDAVAPQYAALAADVEETVDCLRAGVLLTVAEGQPLAAMLFAVERGPMPELHVEAVAADREVADRWLKEIEALAVEHNAYRGKVLSFSFGRHGDFGLQFMALPHVQRSDVILGAGELEAIEAHAIGIAEHAQELRSAGKHVRRGLLLYGPPGTGKTHTVSYIVGQMPGRTTIILSGPALRALGQAGTLARSFEPATVIIEDVDLIAMDRGHPGSEQNALLFQLLNEMDGLNDDADVLFVLTTNRVDQLEEALTARPGRIDQAIEIDVPGPQARRHLLELYSPGASDVDDALVDRLEGVSPAFIKELSRRAELRRLRSTDASGGLSEALDEMLAESAPVLLRTLGGGGASVG